MLGVECFGLVQQQLTPICLCHISIVYDLPGSYEVLCITFTNQTLTNYMDKVRVDKWLWSVRIFKTRTKATDALKAGQVKVNGKNVKASYQVQRGDRLKVGKNGFNFQFEVVDLIAKRVGAPIAQKCYLDHTPAEELSKYSDWFIGKRGTEVRDKGAGRPTKRERREIEDFKLDRFEDWED